MQTGKCENLVTRSEQFHGSAYRFNFACQFLSQYFSSGPSETESYPCEWPQPNRHLEFSKFAVSCCYCCRVDSYQNFIVFRSRSLYLFELENVRWSVFCAYNRLHLQC